MKRSEYIQKLLSEKYNGEDNVLNETTVTALWRREPPQQKRSTNNDLILGIVSGAAICFCEDYEGLTTTDWSGPCTSYCNGYDPCPTWCSQNDNPCAGTDISCPEWDSCLEYTGACASYGCICHTGETCTTNISNCSCDVNCNCVTPIAIGTCEVYSNNCTCDGSIQPCSCHNCGVDAGITCVPYTEVCSCDGNVCTDDCSYTACTCYEGSLQCPTNIGVCECDGQITACTCHNCGEDQGITCSPYTDNCTCDEVAVCTCDSCDYCASDCYCYGYCNHTATYAWYYAFTVALSGRVEGSIYKLWPESQTTTVDISQFNSFQAIASLVSVSSGYVGCLWQTEYFTIGNTNYKTYWCSGVTKPSTGNKYLSAASVFVTGHQILEGPIRIQAYVSQNSGTYGRKPNSNSQLTGSSYLNKFVLDQNKYTVKVNGPIIESQNSEYEVISPYNSTYGFIFSESLNMYTSNNMGINNSYAMCRISITAGSPDVLTISYINNAESTYDYGSFGKLDLAMGSGTSMTNVRLALSSSTHNSSSRKTITYDIPAGTHFIDVKFRKDGTVSANNDALRFIASFANAQDNRAKAHYDVTFGAPVSLSARTGSMGICSVSSSASTSMVAISVSREGSAPMMGTCVGGQVLELTPTSNYQLATTRVLSGWSQDVTIMTYLNHIKLNKITMSDGMHGTDIPKSGSTATTYTTFYAADEYDYGTVRWIFNSGGFATYASQILTARVEVKVARESLDDHYDDSGNVYTNYGKVRIDLKTGVYTIEEIGGTSSPIIVQCSTTAITYNELRGSNVTIEVGYYGLKIYGVSLFVGLANPASGFTEETEFVWTDDMGLVQNPEYEPSKKNTRLHDIKSLDSTRSCTTYNITK